MNYKYEKIAEWNNKCPLCRSSVIWSLSDGSHGAKSVARCGNSPYASVITKRLKDLKFCHWKGEAVRQKDGSVRIRNENKEWLKELYFVDKN